MKAQFDHTLISNFYLWFESVLNRDDNKAYATGVANTFQKITRPDIHSSLNVFQGEFRQLVADTGVDVPNSGVFVDGSFVPANTDGLIIDYSNGRVLLPTASGASPTITANSTIKEINTYITDDDAGEIIMHSDFLEQGQSMQYFSAKNKDNDKSVYFLPACFITVTSGSNEEFCFGGEEESKTRITVLVITKDDFQLQGLFSIFKDTVRETIELVNYEDFPYGAYFDLKSAGYSYDDYVAANKNSQETWIDEVGASSLNTDDIKKKLGSRVKVGIINFDLKTRRFPRL